MFKGDISTNNGEYDGMHSNRSFLVSQLNQRGGSIAHNSSRLLAQKLAPGPKKRKKIFSFNKEKEDLLQNNMIGMESQVFNMDSRKNEVGNSKNSFLCLQSKLGTSVFDSMKMGENGNKRNGSVDMRGKRNTALDQNEYTKPQNPFDLDEYRNKHLKDVTKDFINFGNKRKGNVSFLRAVDLKDDNNSKLNLENDKNNEAENKEPNAPILKRAKRANFLERIKKMRNLSSLQIAPSDLSGKPHTHRPKQNNLLEHFEVARDLVQKNRLLKQQRGPNSNVSMNFAFKDQSSEIQNMSLNVDMSQRNLPVNFDKSGREFNNRHARVSSNHLGAQSGAENLKKNILHRKTPSLNLNFVPGFGNGLHELLNGNKKITQRVLSGFNDNYDGTSLQSFERDMININGISQKISKPISTISGILTNQFL